jgi:5-(carboxyamino)imidazole ribonucleotide mutase
MKIEMTAGEGHVAIIFGGKGDTEVMKGAAEALAKLGVGYSVHLMSAHRVPALLEATVESLVSGGCDCFIAGAGLAAHLPGVVASKTCLPVIGVPVKGALEGLDSLFSMVQMPKGIPVATVAINNSFNAGLLAAQILSLKYPGIKRRYADFRREMTEAYERESDEGVTL